MQRQSRWKTTLATILLEIDLVRDDKRQRSNIFSIIGIFYNHHCVRWYDHGGSNGQNF